MDEDWGFAYQERIFAAPLHHPGRSRLPPSANCSGRSTTTPASSSWSAGPIVVHGVGRSPADPLYDPFWSLANESGITVCYHGGDTVYSNYLPTGASTGRPSRSGRTPSGPSRLPTPSRTPSPTCWPMASSTASPTCGWRPSRPAAPGSSTCTRSWRSPSARRLTLYPEDPRETFKRHVWVSPFYEDELDRLRDLIGADHILMGSDYPHAEGLAEPASYIKDLRNFAYSDERLPAGHAGQRAGPLPPAPGLSATVLGGPLRKGTKPSTRDPDRRTHATSHGGKRPRCGASGGSTPETSSPVAPPAAGVDPRLTGVPFVP